MQEEMRKGKVENTGEAAAEGIRKVRQRQRESGR